MAYSDDISAMLADVQATFGESITLKKLTPGAVNATSGIRAATEQTQSLLANRLPIRQATRAVGDGRLRDDERTFEVVIAAVTLGTPEPGWVVIDGSKTFRVVEVDTDAHRLNYILRCRGSV